MNRDKARSDGFLLLCLGALMFVALGFLMVTARKDSGLDFRIAYSTARCLVEHRDPYNQDELLQVYRENGGTLPQGGMETLRSEGLYIYLPTIFVATVPLLAFSMPVAYLVWTAVAAIGFLIAALMMWDVGKEHAPLLTGALLCCYLANSGSLISTGNAASIALSLGIIGAWCILRERWVVAGLLFVALSLAIKPHDSAFLWLGLVFCGGVFRRRALQSLAVMLCVSLPFVVWVWRIAPEWVQEMRAHIAVLSAHGAVSDPGPATVLNRGTLALTNLQAVFSLAWDEPRFYNVASYAVCTVLAAVAIWVTVRRRPTESARWMAMAFAAALTLLPVYHRQYDSKLLILTIPACALLWSQKGRVGKVALIVTALGLLVTSDLPWAFYLAGTSKMQLTGIAGRLYFLSLAVTVPCVVTMVAVFFLWAYVTSMREKGMIPEIAEPQRAAPSN
jgi:hypothetical protein